jgi:hypothetical protein
MRVMIFTAVLIVAMAAVAAMADQKPSPGECGSRQFTCTSGTLSGVLQGEYTGDYYWDCGATPCHLKVDPREFLPQVTPDGTCTQACKGSTVGDVGTPHGCSPWCYSHCDWQAAGCREVCATADGRRGNQCPDGRCRVETGEPCL